MTLTKTPTYKRWTFAETLILLQSWRGKSSISVIAKKLKTYNKRIEEKATQLKLDARGKHSSWSKEEELYLESLAETCTLDDLVIKYNIKIKCGKDKWLYRSKESIEKKLRELGYSVKPLVGYVSLKQLGIYLGRTYRYMQKLVENNKLPVTKVSSNYVYVKETDFIEFAKIYPFDVGEKMTNEGMIWFLQILKEE